MMTLIIPMAADKPEYNIRMPWIFNLGPDGISLCIKSILGLDLTRFRHIYFTILKKTDDRFHISDLLNIQFKKQNISQAKIVILDETTSSQAETVYQTIKKKNVKGFVFIKDADSYFEGDFTLENGITVFPLDKLDTVNPSNKSYVALDDQFYITNIIEKKIISRYFNAGGYLFEDALEFCENFEELRDQTPLYMSHIVYLMLLKNRNFRPIKINNYIDWGTEKQYLEALQNTYKNE